MDGQRGVLDQVVAPAPSVVPVCRELPPQEWDRLRDFEPFSSKGLPSADRTRILVLESPAGAIVGWWFLFLAYHAEPLWIHPDYRGKAASVGRLVKGMQNLLADEGTLSAFALIGTGAEDVIRTQAERMGFEKIPADIYLLSPKGPTNGR
jgi:hypothetical protein